MTTINLTELVELLEGDQELLESLMQQGLITKGTQDFGPEEIETVLVTRTLVRDLDVNWAGVEVILRMRRQLLLTRLRLAEIADSIVDKDQAKE